MSCTGAASIEMQQQAQVVLWWQLPVNSSSMCLDSWTSESWLEPRPANKLRQALTLRLAWLPSCLPLWFRTPNLLNFGVSLSVCCTCMCCKCYLIKRTKLPLCVFVNAWDTTTKNLRNMLEIWLKPIPWPSIVIWNRHLCKMNGQVDLTSFCFKSGYPEISSEDSWQTTCLPRSSSSIAIRLEIGQPTG